MCAYVEGWVKMLHLGRGIHELSFLFLDGTIQSCATLCQAPLYEHLSVQEQAVEDVEAHLWPPHSHPSPIRSNVIRSRSQRTKMPPFTADVAVLGHHKAAEQQVTVRNRHLDFDVLHFDAFAGTSAQDLRRTGASFNRYITLYEEAKVYLESRVLCCQQFTSSMLSGAP